MNAHTWQSLRPIALGLFAIVGVEFIFPSSHPFLQIASNVALIILMVLCFTGAWFGLLLVLGRLHFGCPFCHTRSPIIGATKTELFLTCPECGEICVTARAFGSAVSEKISRETDDSNV